MSAPIGLVCRSRSNSRAKVVDIDVRPKGLSTDREEGLNGTGEMSTLF